MYTRSTAYLVLRRFRSRVAVLRSRLKLTLGPLNLSGRGTKPVFTSFFLCFFLYVSALFVCLCLFVCLSLPFFVCLCMNFSCRFLSETQARSMFDSSSLSRSSQLYAGFARLQDTDTRFVQVRLRDFPATDFKMFTWLLCSSVISSNFYVAFGPHWRPELP